MAVLVHRQQETHPILDNQYHQHLPIYCKQYKKKPYYENHYQKHILIQRKVRKKTFSIRMTIILLYFMYIQFSP